MTDAPPGGIRESARAVVAAAQSAGVAGAEGLLRLTPAEIEGEFAALREARRREAENADLAAWLTGQYVLLAVHAPRRYPKRPDRVAARPATMDAGDMLRTFRAMAKREEEMTEHGDH